MGEQNKNQEHVADPARPPLTVARAHEMTAGLREVMDDVRRSVAVLAARVRDAHAARVWMPLAHPSWESYCAAEFGISRVQAYRLLEVAHSSPRSTAPSRLAPRRLARETPARPPRTHSNPACPNPP